MSQGKPFVSVVTPTYNRRKFIPMLIELYKAQTYPKDRMEWIIYDDSNESVEDLFIDASRTIPNILYFYSPTRANIGAKRNWLNAKAKGEFIVSMDDDDYYFPERIAYTITMFSKFPKLDVAGCSESYMYYTDDNSIWKLGPYALGHATNGTLAIRASYLKNHKHDESVLNAEEKSFLDEFKKPLIQLDAQKIMLVISHKENTFSKMKFREQSSKFVVKTSYKLRDFIRNKSIRDFFSNV